MLSTSIAALYFVGGLLLLYLGGASLVSGTVAIASRFGMTTLA